VLVCLNELIGKHHTVKGNVVLGAERTALLETQRRQPAFANYIQKARFKAFTEIVNAPTVRQGAQSLLLVWLCCAMLLFMMI